MLVRAYKKPIAVIVLVICMMFVCMNKMLLLTSYVDTLVATSLYPLLKIQAVVVYPFHSVKKYCTDYNALCRSFDIVSQQKEALLARTIELQSSLRFIQETKELVDFQRRYKDFDSTLAQVMVKNLSEHTQFFLVDKGSAHGVAVDMVAAYKNCLVGRVSEVFPYYSKVVLITDRSCKVASCCASTKINGILQGANESSTLMLTHVSHLDTLQKQDLVLSSGQGLIFPKGFGLGRIEFFALDGLQYTIHVVPLLDFKTLEYCYLMQRR
jgi:rod shape-determining protein MreC